MGFVFRDKIAVLKPRLIGASPSQYAIAFIDSFDYAAFLFFRHLRLSVVSALRPGGDRRLMEVNMHYAHFHVNRKYAKRTFYLDGVH